MRNFFSMFTNCVTLLIRNAKFSYPRFTAEELKAKFHSKLNFISFKEEMLLRKFIKFKNKFFDLQRSSLKSVNLLILQV